MLEKYCVKEDPSGGLKVVRTIVWRLLSNLSKYSHSQKIIHSSITPIILSAIETLTRNKADGGVINACTMALNNMIFVESFEFNEIPDQDIFKALADNFSSDNENTLVALLNILCRLITKGPTFKEYLKKSVYNDMKTRLDTLKYHKNITVQKMVEDVYFLLG